MQTYQQPDRPSQNVFCRSGSPKPALCAFGQGFDPEVENIPLSSLEVKASIIETAGLGVYFKESARKGSYLGIEESVHSILLKPSTYDNVESMKKFGLEYFKAWEKYNEGYGYAHTFFGDVGHSVDPSILTFMNHGCNGTYSVGFATEVTEITADETKMPPSLASFSLETAKDNPFIDRNYLVHLHTSRTLRDVQAGEEVLENYLAFHTDEDWEAGVKAIRAQCASRSPGLAQE